MPEISFSVKDMAEVVSSAAKAFDDLYSTLRRVAVDGWVGIGAIIGDVRNRRDEERVRDYVYLLRSLQIKKLGASVTITSYMNSTSKGNWLSIETTLTNVLQSTIKAKQSLEDSTSITLPMILGDKFPSLVTGFSVREALVGKILDTKPAPSANVDHLDRLVALLDLEAKLIGKCADLLTEFLESWRKEKSPASEASSEHKS